MDDWIPLQEAFRLARITLGDRKYASDKLLEAFKRGTVRTVGEEEETETSIRYRNIKVNTNDFMLWLNTTHAMATGKLV